MPSQYNEHEHILKHFQGRVGSFIDVGAYDGKTYSNTRYLMELGWTGICVEPNPMVFPYLMENTKQFPKVKLVQAAISSSPGLRKLWACQDCYSTFDGDFMRKVARNNDALAFKEIFVSSIRWQDLEVRGADFVNIDVEGMNLEVLKAMTIDAEMICIEMDPPYDRREILEILYNRGYLKCIEIGGNLLCVR